MVVVVLTEGKPKQYSVTIFKANQTNILYSLFDFYKSSEFFF